MKKRITCFLLALLMVFSAMPTSVFANGTVTYTTDYSANKGGTAVFNEYEHALVYIASVPGEGWENYEATFDPAEYYKLKMNIDEVYVGSAGLWYKVSAAEGYTLPAALVNCPWIFQNDLPTPMGIDALIVTPPVVEPTEPTDPVDPSEPSDPSDPVDPELPAISGTVTDSEGNPVTDANGNPLTVTVQGDLPEGATVSASIPEIDGEKLPNVFDIKVLLPDGTEWQPIDEGKTVTVSIPVDTNAEYVDVIHFIDYAPAINENVEYVPVEGANPEILALLLDAIEASNVEGSVPTEVLSKIRITDGFVEFETNSFSIYAWENSKFIPIGDEEDNTTEVSFPNNTLDSDQNNQVIREYYATSDHLFTLTTATIVTGASSCAFSVVDEATITSGTTTGTFKTTVQGVTREVLDDGWLSRHSATFVIPATAAPGETIVLRFNARYTFFVVIHIVDLVDVTFDKNLDSAVLASTKKEGIVTDGDTTKNVFTIPTSEDYIPTPTDSHYEFKGWNTTPDGTGTSYNYDSASNTFSPTAFTPMRDMTLYAMWASENSVVKFDPNGGTGLYEDQTVKTGRSITLPEGPTRTNYVFLGWSASPDGYSTPYAAGSSYVVNQDTTLYAIWGVDLTINVSGGTELLLQKEGDFESKPLEEHTYTNGQPVFIYEPTTSNGVTTYRTILLEGFLKNARFTFKYASNYKTNDPASTGAQVNFTKQTNQVIADTTADGINVNTTISFSAVPQGQKSFIVSYNTNYGTPVASTVLQGLENDRLRLETLPTDEDTTRTGYKLEGWFLDEALTQPATVPMDVTANITLHAQWVPISYTATWVVDGTVVEEKEYAYGTELVKPTSPSKSGYFFTGWSGYTDGMTMPAGDTTFTAQWKEQYSYKLNFNANVPADATATVNGMPGNQTQGWCDDATKTFTWTEVPTLTNYKFRGWSTDPSATTGSTAKEHTITGTGAQEVTVTLYAIWELDVAKYYIEYYLMNTDGTYSTNYVYREEYTDTIGKPVSADPQKFTGLAAGIVYDADCEDNRLNATVADDGSTTLKVYYERIQYTVTYMVDGVQYGTANKFYYGSEVEVLAEPSKDGYTFSGWTITGATATNGKFNMPANDVTIEGTFTADDDTLYTVETYKQKLDGSYEMTSETMHGTTDTEAIITLEVPTGFKHNAEKSVMSGNIAGDGSLVLKVYYDRETYTVTWNVDGRETTESYLFGAKITKAEEPQKQGYKFTGWLGYTEDMTMPAENKTFTADWDPRTDTPYVVKHLLQNVTGDGYTVVETENLAGTTDDKVTPEVNTYEGFKSPSAVTVTIAPDGSTVVEYKYDRIEYTVIYVADGKTIHTEKVRFEGNVATVPQIPAKEGYTQTAPTWSHNGQNITGDTTINAQYTINKYTITTTMENGSISGKADTYNHGTAANVTFTPNTGYKITGVTVNGEAQTNFTESSYVYSNASMDKNVEIVVTTVLKTYTIQFVNEDGTVLQSSEVTHGDKPEYTGATPTKASTTQYSYTFASWSPMIEVATGNKTYTATYTSTINEYTITWVDGDGKTIKTETLAYGTTPAYSGATPTKAATAQYTYTFNQTWSPEIATVTGDATYTAQFNSAVNYYTITWKNENGVTLDTDSVAYGDMPAYTGATPVKAADAQYTYTHSGWTPSVVAVTGDATYTATYSSTVNKYTITWKNYDGTVLQSGKVPYGTVPTYTGDTPVKPQDDNYIYSFSGEWSPAVVSVTGDAEYVAQFDSADRYYTITWLNWDGTVLEIDNAKFNTTVKYDGEAPSKEPDQQYWYNFEGWEAADGQTFGAAASVTVTGNASYQAVLNPKLQEYTVSWIVEGVVKEEKAWEYGKTPTFSSPDPVKAADNGYTYEFVGWTPVIVPVVDKVEYEAVFNAIKKIFTITYHTDENGVSGAVSGNPDTYTIETPDIKLNNPTPTLPYYHFAGWTGTDVSENSTAVVINKGSYGDRQYFAHYALNDYTITFNTNGADQETLEAMPYRYGATLALPKVTKTGYTFVWKVEAASGNWAAGEVAENGAWNKYGDITLIAEWTPNTYTVKFDGNGAEGTSGENNTIVSDGKMADQTMTYDAPKQLSANQYVRTGYSFVGWNTAADGSGETYGDAATVSNLVAENGGEITLYAQWEINTFNLFINTHNSIDANQTYIFTVSGETVDGREISLTVALGANDWQRIVNLPAGTYTISDQPDWSWRYAGQKITDDVHADKVVDFNYTYNAGNLTEIYWLNSYGNEQLKVNPTRRKK